MRRAAFGLMFAALLGACSTLVGADFDGLELAAGGGEGGSTGGDGGSGDAGEGGGASGEGGATGGEAGASGAGGERSAGAGGQPAGGEGGAAGDGGAAGHAGEGGSAGAGGASGAAGMPGCADAGAGGANGDGSVLLNEIKGQGSGDDFIELYNPGPAELDLTGYGVSDGSNTLVFPSGTSLEACSFLLVLLGQQEAGGGFTCFTPNPCFHATWGVSSSGEVVVLRDAASVVIDSATYPDEDLMIVVDGQTWGRLPDGTGAFQATLPTPEAPNAEE